MNPFDIFLVNPIFNLLVAIYKVLEATSIPGALGFAIIALTAILKITTWPLTKNQLESTKKMADLKPHIERIKKEHGHDKVKHQEEITKLYKEHGINPLASCLPMIIQILPFFALYNVLSKIVSINGTDALAKINERLYIAALHLQNSPSTDFFGLNLAAKPAQWREIGILILAVPLITALFQLVQSQMMLPHKEPKDSPPAGGKDVEKKEEDMSAQIQSQMALFMPATMAWVAYSFPIGLSLYLNTFTILGIIQQYKLAGTGALTKYLPKKLKRLI